MGAGCGATSRASSRRGPVVSVGGDGRAVAARAPSGRTRSVTDLIARRQRRRGSSACCRESASRFFVPATPAWRPSTWPSAAPSLGLGDATTYRPSTGARFLTRDPAAAITREPYAYGANDPINMVDRSGLAPWDAVTDFVDKAAPIVRGVSGVVADVAGVCAVVMKAGCAQVAVGASAVKATASTYMYARGDLSRGDLLTDYVQVGLSALDMRASGRASALEGRAASVLDDRAARVASSARWGSIPGLLRRGTTSPMLLRAGALEFRASMWWGLGALSDGTGLGLSGNSYLDC